MQMSSQRIVKNTILLYMRQLFTLALGLYTTRLTLQLLGVIDYGIYAAASGITGALIILSSVFTIGSQRFLTVELAKQDYRQMNHVYIACTNLQAAFSGLLLLIGETVGLWFLLNQMNIPEERIAVAFWVYQISLFTQVFAMLNVPNEAVVASHENFGFIAIMSVVVSLLKLFSVIVLFYLSWDKLFVYSLFLFSIQIANRTVFLRYCKNRYMETRYHFLWDKPLMKSMLKISAWYGMYGIANSGLLHGFAILLNIFFGPVLNAAFAVASQVYLGIRIFCTHFQSASYTQIVSLYTLGELSKLNTLLFSVCKMSFFLIFVISLPFLFNTEYVFALWLGNVPEHAASFFVLLILFAYLDVFMLPLDRSCLATGNVKTYYMIVSIVLFIIIPLSYMAFYYGAIPETAYFIAIAMSLVGLIVRIILLGKLISLNQTKFYKEVIMKVLIVSFLSIVFPFVYHRVIRSNGILIIIDFVSTYIITALLVYKLGLNESERCLVKQVIVSGKKKILLR